MSRLRWVVICLLVGFFVVNSDGMKKYPAPVRSLPPLFVTNIGADVPEPSGLTFCKTTGHLYTISDASKDHYIYELYTNGSLVRRLEMGEAVRSLNLLQS
jgi:hypothetical protein